MPEDGAMPQEAVPKKSPQATIQEIKVLTDKDETIVHHPNGESHIVRKDGMIESLPDMI